MLQPLGKKTGGNDDNNYWVVREDYVGNRMVSAYRAVYHGEADYKDDRMPYMIQIINNNLASNSINTFRLLNGDLYLDNSTYRRDSNGGITFVQVPYKEIVRQAKELFGGLVLSEETISGSRGELIYPEQVGRMFREMEQQMRIDKDSDYDEHQ